MNNLAYNDICDHLEPRYPDDPEYMCYYRFWRSIANWPDDRYEPE
jgi:hypothetical protein